MWNENRKKLIDVFENPLFGGGILTALQSQDVPWKNDTDIDPTSLDLEYFGNVSGAKYVSNVIDTLLKMSNTDKLDLSQQLWLANLIYTMNIKNWRAQWETLNYEYNPIENYSMVEEMTDDETIDSYGKTTTRTDNLTDTRTGSEQNSYGKTNTRTDNLTDTRTGSETDDYGKTSTRTDNLTDKKTGTETEQYGKTTTRTDNLTDTKTGTETDQYGKSTTRTDNLQEVKSGGETETRTPNELTKTRETQIAGYNESEYSNSEKVTETESGSETKQLVFNGETTAHTGTETTADSGSDTRTYNLTEEHEGTQQNADSGADTRTYNLTEKHEGTQENADSGTDTHTYNAVKDTHNGTQQSVDSGADTHTYNNVKDTHEGTQATVDSGADTHTRNYHLTRSGNIGVTTSQQMIQSERDLWIWNFFRDVVFKDLDKVLALSIY